MSDTAPLTGEATPRIFRKKPVVVEAVQWTGHNWPEVLGFGGRDAKVASTVHDGPEEGSKFADAPLQLLAGKDGAQGWVNVPLGHWLVRNPGDASDIWPVDSVVFAMTYEEHNSR